MKTISKLAAKIKCEKKTETLDNGFKRLTEILDNGFKRLTDSLNKFNEDFRSVIPELISCDVKYEACFLHQKNDDKYYYFPQDTCFNGSVCISNSILFTFEHNGKERKKRLFYNQNNYNGWYYIAENGALVNDTIYLKDYRDDLILFLDGTFKGEYK